MLRTLHMQIQGHQWTMDEIIVWSGAVSASGKELKMYTYKNLTQRQLLAFLNRIKMQKRFKIRPVLIA